MHQYILLSLSIVTQTNGNVFLFLSKRYLPWSSLRLVQDGNLIQEESWEIQVQINLVGQQLNFGLIKSKFIQIPILEMYAVVDDFCLCLRLCSVFFKTTPLMFSPRSLDC